MLLGLYLVPGVLALLWPAAAEEATERQAVYRWVCQGGKCKKLPLESADLNTALSIEACKMFCTQYEGKCKKLPLESADLNTALSIEACKMFCTQYGTLWPMPTGDVELGNTLVKLNINSIDVEITKHGKSDPLMQAAAQRFKKNIPIVIPDGAVLGAGGGKSLVVHLVNIHPDVTKLSLTTDESYKLQTSSMSDGRTNATVTAINFFGLRHGLETLSQLIIYDEIRNELQLVKNAQITDNPTYPYRGVLLDTARNYYSLDSIKRTIEAMAAVKLNTFHWHITDTQSFPFVSESRPNLSKLGALGPNKVYTKAAIRDVVAYARVRGVRVLPEFDAPAHVGEGWQGTDMTVCFKADPWRSYCVEPPCGQLNPARAELYNVLEDIYRDMLDAFQPDMLHMGGDEVSESCWNSSREIQEFMVQNRWGLRKKDFLKLWDYFQVKAKERVFKANKNVKLPLILWTSTLTDFNHIENYLSNEEYIIQVWTGANDPQINGLLAKGYKLIFSNYDALYLDCGFGSWIGKGNNWCSPYIGWQKIYDNSPNLMATHHKDQILGGEAALWSEQSDASSLDNRLWPRAAALAERLWTEPPTSWVYAEQRMLHVRERLVKLGCQADSIEPEWCFQNEGHCYS